MRHFSSWRFTGSASLLRTTILLCLGVFLLSWSAGGSEVSAVLNAADAPFAEQSTDSDGYPLDGTYLAEFAQESEPDDRLLKNSAPLKTLVSVLFFGTALWWIAVSSWMRTVLMQVPLSQAEIQNTYKNTQIKYAISSLN